MLACVSPADSNLEETLSTLRYADRTRKIKNKPIVNRDPHVAELAKLRQQVQQLQVQLLASGSVNNGLSQATNDEVNSLLSQLKLYQDENEKLNRALQTALDENTNMAEKALLAEMARDRLKTRLEELRCQTGNTVEVLNKTLDVTLNPQLGEQIDLIKEIQNKIIDLQGEQRKNETMMMEHELSRHSITTKSMNGIKTEDLGEGQKDADSRDPDSGLEDSPSKQFGTAYTLRQAKLNEELQDLNKALALKEELMSKMSNNDTQFVAMKIQYEKEKQDLEKTCRYFIQRKR
ncbi:chromosome-associated kinesin KIF4-like [Macrobrachium nipponense]|uniref:chromosome-associated kinesin KIF4-like n=1 Tax=Macrobrachium nipponense TaxID=159736 RepID=UPI0030C8AF06